MTVNLSDLLDVDPMLRLAMRRTMLEHASGEWLEAMRRMVEPERRGATGRGTWRFSAWMADVLFGGPIELETRGNLREWMVMSEDERIAALSVFWADGIRRRREIAGEGPAPLRQARTSLGYGLIGTLESPEDDLDDLEIYGGTIVSGSTVPADGKWILYVPREEKREKAPT